MATQAIDVAQWLLRRAREAMSDLDLVTAGALTNAAQIALREARAVRRHGLDLLPSPTAGEGEV